MAPVTLIMFMQQRQKENFAQCEEPSRSDRVRGLYENKIRFFSPPEKTFEIFATSKTEDGELRMSYKDFLRAMTPFCYTPFFEDTDKYLENNTPEILKRIDADGDGTISFTEFFFFLVMLQISPQKLRRAFKKYPEAKLTREQCSEMLHTLRKNTQAGSRQANQAKLDARAVKASEEDFRKTNLCICELLFKDCEVVTLQDFLALQDRFREDLWHYRFHALEPNDEGRISTEDFLKANLVALKSADAPKYLAQIKKIAAGLGD